MQRNWDTVKSDRYPVIEGIKGKRIMVVDDEFDLTLFYKMLLEFHGFRVDTFNDPRKALSSFKPDYYNLVILDIKMPGMDGFELNEELQKIDSKVNVCFLTASELYYKEFRKKEYYALDKELFIRKPVEDEELLKEISRLIR
jgi:DNA-binding response OmpR family regulator